MHTCTHMQTYVCTCTYARTYELAYLHLPTPATPPLRPTPPPHPSTHTHTYFYNSLKHTQMHKTSYCGHCQKWKKII